MSSADPTSIEMVASLENQKLYRVEDPEGVHHIRVFDKHSENGAVEYIPSTADSQPVSEDGDSTVVEINSDGGIGIPDPEPEPVTVILSSERLLRERTSNTECKDWVSSVHRFGGFRIQLNGTPSQYSEKQVREALHARLKWGEDGFGSDMRVRRVLRGSRKPVIDYIIDNDLQAFVIGVWDFDIEVDGILNNYKPMVKIGVGRGLEPSEKDIEILKETRGHLYKFVIPSDPGGGGGGGGGGPPIPPSGSI